MSALFFGLTHLNNFFGSGFSPLLLTQVIWAFFLGFAYAAFRLYTRTIWPLVLFHICNDLSVIITLFAIPTNTTARGSIQSAVAVYIALIALTLVLAIYGFYLLRFRMQTSSKFTT